MSSIFTKIINREIPAHIVYEDDGVIAFMDINPVQPGQTVVVPKTEVDHFEDLPDDVYTALMVTAKHLAKRLRGVMGTKRVCLVIEGFDVPHVHVKLIPANSGEEFMSRPGAAEQDELQRIADQLRA